MSYKRVRPNSRCGTIRGWVRPPMKKSKKVPSKKVVSFEFKEDADTLTLEKCFSSNMTVERKNWLMEYDVKNYIVPEKVMSFSHYLNQELIQYSIADCKRSLPSLLDGLKESQRKILFTLFKRNLHYKKFTNKSRSISGLLCRNDTLQAWRTEFGRHYYQTCS